MPESIGTPFLWVAFTAFVLGLLALDLGVFHRKAHAVGVREAAVWSAVWVALALLFNAWIYHAHGKRLALEFLTGYLIEKALSVDNLFVFIVIFSYFGCRADDQHRVLFWGIVGALVMRAVFIWAGAALLSAFHWMEYVFGAFLVFTGGKILLHRAEEVHPERNLAVRLAQRILPLVPAYHGHRFFVKVQGRWAATPLVLVLIVVETTDVVFAVDSIPAIFAVTKDPFIVYTSNIFAILGLRALYFLLAGVMQRFQYLKVGLGLVLVFVGAKMVLSDVWSVPIGWSLAVVGGLLAGSILASLVRPAAPPAAPRER